jgi:hypothetical protein
MTTRPIPARHWRSYGNDTLPHGAEALDEPFRSFPSWFMRVTCDRCGKDRKISAHTIQRDMPIREILKRMRYDGCGGRAGGRAAQRYRGRQQPASAADRIVWMRWFHSASGGRRAPAAAAVRLPVHFRRADCGTSGMSDRLALANAIEDTGIERGKAEQLAATIFDGILDHVATKAGLGLLHAEVVGMRSATTGVQDEIALLAHKADVRSVSIEAARVGSVTPRAISAQLAVRDQLS